MSICHGVLIDTVSIQDYIFQSNRLKENLGASFLVEEVYHSFLKKAVEEVFRDDGFEPDLDAWKNDPSKITSCREPFETGYIGGGSALLFFREKEKAQAFITSWTRLLMIHAPGITTAVASTPFDPDDFSRSRDKLLKLLRDNKFSHIPQTVIPRHGFTSECSRTGLSMEIWNRTGDAPAYVSATANARIEAAAESRKSLHTHPVYREILKDTYCFPELLDKLGGIGGEDSHIAIVHIDGNSMGDRFRNIDTLEGTRALSLSVEQATRNAFAKLLEQITFNFPRIMEALGFDGKIRPYMTDKDSGKYYLPIRPIILGGDDITFVCDGKLGIYFSRLFMEAFQKEPAGDGEPLTACAGIAIVKTAYPFYRGYRLAEELCDHAKTVRQKEGEPHCYLDFHVSTGGFSGSLEKIRADHFTGPQGSILFRPYKLTDEADDPRSFELFVKNTGELGNFPGNKRKELREVLTLSREGTDRFVRESEYRGRSLPEIPGFDFHKAPFQEDPPKTPYFDMIELLEYYPDFVWENMKEGES